MSLARRVGMAHRFQNTGRSKQAKESLAVPGLMTASRERQRESTIWQRRFWEHQIRDELDFQKHFDYIHYNPVKHGLVSKVCDWPYSTFHRYVGQGVYDRGWGTVAPELDGTFGE